MRLLVCVFIAAFAFASMAIAYPKDQLKECILGAKRSPLLVGVPALEVERWCDCTLELILDEGKADKLSASYCGHKYFH